ncbi:LysR substrate-binding domain-containing protein [Poseidonocella sp. HB161398]|uniref:LysR substrate-binding domain-containing protein n=1 Tax=Poseidonocella sp. HB161398 TaxID=2320855 RepID=UPI001108BDFC|nr:LysR substrate-binding domain-containing protein [Poseidonocella sp. HB161398]
MKLNIRQVEAFRAVVAMQSMSRAAELLGISQPAVSRLIGDLQKAVGMKLFVRTRTGAVPTPDARQFYEQVEKLFIGFEELGNHLSAIKQLQVGHLTIAATSSYMTGLLPGIMAEFKAAHPDIKASLHILPHEQIIDWVQAGRCEIGLTSQDVVGSAGLVTVPLARADMVCVFPQGHRFERMAELTPVDFEGEAFVSFPTGSSWRFLIDRLFDQAGVDRRLTTDATSHHAVCALVQAGMGVALVNPFARSNADGTRFEVRPVRPSLSMELLMLLRDGERSSVAEAFRVFLEAEATARLAALTAWRTPVPG